MLPPFEVAITSYWGAFLACCQCGLRYDRIATSRGGCQPKRPAGAWTDKAGHAQLAYQNADDDLANGVSDSRTTSRAQRKVYTNYHDEIADREAVERYDFLTGKECNIKGRFKEANEILNALIPRRATWTSAPKVKASTVVYEILSYNDSGFNTSQIRSFMSALACISVKVALCQQLAPKMF